MRYEESEDSLSESETSFSDQESYHLGSSYPDRGDEQSERKARYLQPTISFLSKGARGKEREGNGAWVENTGTSREDDAAPNAHQHNRPSSARGGHIPDERRGKAAPERVKEGERRRPRSSQRRQEAVQSLKDRERGKRKARGREKAPAARRRDHQRGQKAGRPAEPKQKGKHVRFQGEDAVPGSPGNFEGVEGGDHGQSRPSTSQARGGRAEYGIHSAPRRLWDEVPEDPDELYSSLAADIRAVFDRAMTDTSPPSSRHGPPSDPIESLSMSNGLDHADADSYYRREEIELEKKSLILQKELKRVEESRMQLELAASRKVLQKQAKDKLEEYEAKMSRNMETKIRAFMEEKDHKVGEIREFRALIDSKLQKLRQVLTDLQTKEEHLETAYAAAIGEIHSEYKEALERKSREVEAEVGERLRTMVKAMASKRKDASRHSKTKSRTKRSGAKSR